jgi:hypothetical protein
MAFCGMLSARQSSIILTTSTTMIAGLAFRVAALPTSTNKMHLLQFIDTTWANVGVSVFLDSSGHLHFTNAGGSAQAAETGYTGPTIASNTWYYLELKAKYTSSTATGDVQIQVNGALANQLGTGLSTKNAGSGYTYICMGDSAQGQTGQNSKNVDCDDVYMSDDTGTSNTGFLGPCSVETVYPNGVGASTQWTPSSGSNYARVNETIEDGDTSYVSTSGVGNRDSYTCGSLAENPTSIFGVQVTAISRTDASESNRKANTSVRYGGTYTDGITSVAQGGTYGFMRGVFDTDPSSAAWTTASVNAMEAGIKLVS